jgi:hypothetical protein
MNSDQLFEYASSCFRLADASSEQASRLLLQRVGVHLVNAAELLWRWQRRAALPRRVPVGELRIKPPLDGAWEGSLGSRRMRPASPPRRLRPCPGGET